MGKGCEIEVRSPNGRQRKALPDPQEQTGGNQEGTGTTVVGMKVRAIAGRGAMNS